MICLLGNLIQYMRDLLSNANGNTGQALQGKVVLITGASSGIGRELSIAMHSLSMKVILAARNEERLEELRELMINTERTDVFEPKTLSLDLEEPKTLKTKAVDALSLFGEIDIIVNNAGMSVRS